MPPINECDFESPGFEHLRSFQSMSNLYNKLVALNYRKDFCSKYKCPPIHRYYFSIPSDNRNEQRFIFLNLSAWLIKSKCQMNFELQPEEYEDPDATISVITDALKLLLTDEENPRSGKMINLPASRLKQAYGPEVIWTLNIFTDRALELTYESEAHSKKQAKITFVGSKSSTADQRGGTTALNYITIGQPFVGGGLTTRPIGNYQIDDASLLFDDDQNESPADTDLKEANSPNQSIRNDPAERAIELSRAVPVLESAIANLEEEESKFSSVLPHLDSIETTRKLISEFQLHSRSMLETLTARIDQQLKVINNREKEIQTKMEPLIAQFRNVWRAHEKELALHETLLAQVNQRTDQFEGHNNKLAETNKLIEQRLKELSDGTKLKSLEALVGRLHDENDRFDVEIGLLLTVYAKKHTEAISELSVDSKK